MDQRAQLVTEFAAASSVSHRSSATDPNYSENTAKAKHQHRKRFWQQVLVWGAALFAASATFPLMGYAVAGNQRTSCNAVEFSSVCFEVLENQVLAAIALVTLSVWLYNHFWYLRERKHEWKTAVSDAQAMISADKTAEGNTDLFRIYVQTKRRSYWLITLAFAGATAAVAYVVTLAQNDLSLVQPKNPLGVLLVLAAVIGSLGLLRAAYLIGSSFAPGEVIVRHVIALAVLAISNITDIGDARRQVEDRTNEFVRRSPWWFYTSR